VEQDCQQGNCQSRGWPDCRPACRPLALLSAFLGSITSSCLCWAHDACGWDRIRARAWSARPMSLKTVCLPHNSQRNDARRPCRHAVEGSEPLWTSETRALCAGARVRLFQRNSELIISGRRPCHKISLAIVGFESRNAIRSVGRHGRR